MSSMQEKQNMTSDEEGEASLQAVLICFRSVLPHILKAAVDLNILEIMANSDGHLSSSEITSQLPTRDAGASSVIDRILRFLSSHSVLSCKPVTVEGGRIQWSYGLTAIGRLFLRNQEGVSYLPTLQIALEKDLNCWNHIKQATLEGGTPFEKEHGMQFFDYLETREELRRIFNDNVANLTAATMKKILEIYKGFEDVKEVVDVGGGIGANLKLIVSKYPAIRGINFDLPHVVNDAPQIPGVEQVGGDMFLKVPQGQMIFMKYVLHDWSDAMCVKLLKNCYDALPEYGKVVAVEAIAPDFPTTDLFNQYIFQMDMAMFNLSPNGKERTKQEFEALASAAGFSSLKLVCRADNHWVMEFHK